MGSSRACGVAVGPKDAAKSANSRDGRGGRDPVAMARLVFGENSLTGESHSANLAVETLSETRFVHSLALAVPAIVATLEALAKEVDALKAASGIGVAEPAEVSSLMSTNVQSQP